MKEVISQGFGNNGMEDDCTSDLNSSSTPAAAPGMTLEDYFNSMK